MNIPTSLRVHRWRPAAWLRVTGADAATFLQGQFTNDLRDASAGASTYGLWLNVKGKVVADSFVLRGVGADEFWIGSYFSSATVIRERLESFIIADEVVVEDVTDAWVGITLLATGAEALCAKEKRAGFVFRGRRAREESREWVLPASAAEAALDSVTGAREIGADEITRLRIDAGIPAVPTDLGSGDLPNEGGLDVDAISYSKGCYLGQEVMARLKSMGRVRRRLLRVAGVGEKIPPLPATLFSGARKVGELRSVARDGSGGFVGLAMLSLLQITPDASLAFAADGAATIRLLDPP